MYKVYRRGRKVRPLVRNLLETTGVDLSSGSEIPELNSFQDHFRDHKIVVYQGLSWEEVLKFLLNTLNESTYCTMTLKDTVM